MSTPQPSAQAGLRLSNTKTHYGLVARIGHWSSVALVAALFILISGLDVPPKVHDREAVVALHMSLGVLLFILMLSRLAWRLANPNPLLGYPLASWHRMAALTIHRCLYVVVLTLCGCGLLLVFADGLPLAVFGLELFGAGAPAETSLVVSAHAAHLALGDTLLLLVLIHATAAIVNQVFAPPVGG